MLYSHFRKTAQSTCLLVSLLTASVALSQEPEPVTPNVVPSQSVTPNVVRPNIVSYEEYDDPLIRFNRVMFAFNDYSYRYALIPASRFWMNTVPDPVRDGVGRVFDNLKHPIYMTNHLFQGEGRKAGSTLLRFGINTTVGLIGIFDPASSWFGIEREATTASDTLTGYGVGSGAYIVLPFVGSSNLRDGSSIMLDSMLHPLRYVLGDPESLNTRIFGNFQEFAPSAETYLDLRAESDDLYIFMRNMHLQGVQRDAEYRSQ